MTYDSLGQTKVLSLQESISLGLKNHPDYQGAVLDAELSANEIGRAKSDWLPQMRINMGQGTNIGRSIDRFTNAYINELYNSTFAQISLQQSLFQSNRIKHLVDAGELSRLSGQELVEAIKNNLTIRIIQAYLMVLQANELEDMAHKQYVATSEQVNLIKLQVDAGTLAARECLQIKTQQANDEFTAQSLKGQALRVELNLFQLLNIEPETEVRFEKIRTQQPLVSLKEFDKVDFTSMPELKAAALQISCFDSRLKSIKAQNLPSLFLNGYYSTFYASSNTAENFGAQLNGARNGSLSLGLNIPILGKFQTRPQSQALHIQKRLAQNQMLSTALRLSQVYHTSLQNYTLALDQYKIAENQASLAEENLRAVKLQLDAGTINGTDFILAKTNLERANSNLVQSKYSFILEQKIVSFYQTGSWSIE